MALRTSRLAVMISSEGDLSVEVTRAGEGFLSLDEAILGGMTLVECS